SCCPCSPPARWVPLCGRPPRDSCRTTCPWTRGPRTAASAPTRTAPPWPRTRGWPRSAWHWCSPAVPRGDRDAGIGGPAVPVAPAGDEPGQAAPPRRDRRRFRSRGGPLARRLFLIQLVLIVAVCIAL